MTNYQPSLILILLAVIILSILGCNEQKSFSYSAFEFESRNIAHKYDPSAERSKEGYWTEKSSQIHSGSASGLFGSLEGAIFDANDNIYVLDGRNSTINTFDAQGKSIFNFGGAGRGPNELLNAKFIASGRDHLFIYDRNLGIKVFSTAKDSLAHVSTIPVPLEVSGICALNNKIQIIGTAIVTTAYPKDRMLHEFSIAGEYLSSNWPIKTPSANPIVNSAGNTGAVACDQENNIIALMAENSPVVRFFNYTNKTSEQTAAIGGLKLRMIEDTSSDQGISGGVEDLDTFHRVMSIAKFDDTRFIIHLMKGYKENKDPDTGMYSYLFDRTDLNSVTFYGKNVDYVLNTNQDYLLVAKYTNGPELYRYDR